MNRFESHSARWGLAFGLLGWSCSALGFGLMRAAWPLARFLGRDGFLAANLAGDALVLISLGSSSIGFGFSIHGLALRDSGGAVGFAINLVYLSLVGFFTYGVLYQ